VFDVHEIASRTFEKWRRCERTCSNNMSSWRDVAQCNTCDKFWQRGMQYKYDNWEKFVTRKHKTHYDKAK